MSSGSQRICNERDCRNPTTMCCPHCEITLYCSESCMIYDQPGHARICHKDLASRLRGLCIAAVADTALKCRNNEYDYIGCNRYVFMSPRFITCDGHHYWISPFAITDGMHTCVCCSRPMSARAHRPTADHFTYDDTTHGIYRVEYYRCAVCVRASLFLCPTSFTPVCKCWHSISTIVMSMSVHVPCEVLGIIIHMMQSLPCVRALRTRVELNI